MTCPKSWSKCWSWVMHLEKCCPGSEPSLKFRKGFIKALWAFPLKAPVWYSPEAWKIPNKCQRAILGIKLKVLSHPCSQSWGISTQNTTESFSFAQLREGRRLRKGSWLVRWRESSPVGQQEVSPCHAHWRVRCVEWPYIGTLLSRCSSCPMGERSVYMNKLWSVL